MSNSWYQGRENVHFVNLISCLLMQSLEVMPSLLKLSVPSCCLCSSYNAECHALHAAPFPFALQRDHARETQGDGNSEACRFTL